VGGKGTHQGTATHSIVRRSEASKIPWLEESPGVHQAKRNDPQGVSLGRSVGEVFLPTLARRDFLGGRLERTCISERISPAGTPAIRKDLKGLRFLDAEGFGSQKT